MTSNKSLDLKPEHVVEAVNWVQSRKAKPDEQKIISYLMKKYRIKTNDSKQLINEALAEGIVIKVNYAESVSFRAPQKFGQMLPNHQNHIIPFEGSIIPNNAIKRVVNAMTFLLKSVPINQKLGLTLTDLLNQLHNTSQLLNYNECLLERLLRYALNKGYIDRLDSGAYILSAECKTLDCSQDLEFETTDKFEHKMETEKKFDSKEENTIPDGASLLANQSQTAAQKRQKKMNSFDKPKKVLQRLRPISKRKKFKKSLGPDFIESAELGMQYLRDTFEPKCDICSSTTFSSSNSVNVYEELLHCNNCDAKAHPSCLNLDEDVPHKTQWQCSNCKICSVCQQPKDNEFVIICMTCAKGFHVKCHLSSIINCSPKGNWHCKSCCTKGSTSLSNGIIDRKVSNNYDNIFTNQTDDESNDSTNDEESNEIMDALILRNETNSKLTDEQRLAEISNSDNSSDEAKDDEQTNCIDKHEERDEIETNDSNVLTVNVETSNCVNSSNDNINEDSNNVENKTNQSPKCMSLPESPQKWSVSEVESFIRDAGFPVESKIFRDQEIDGRSLMLLRRMDVLTGLSLKLGPALKIYSHIMRLQGRDQFNY